MKKTRFQNYLQQKNRGPMMLQDISRSADKKTDQDFPGFPNGQSSPEMINPATDTEKKVAATDIKDGDKMTREQKEAAQSKVAETNEALSDGSGGAFGATEEIKY